MNTFKNNTARKPAAQKTHSRKTTAPAPVPKPEPTVIVPSEEAIAIAEQFKKEGNDKLASGDHVEALKLYSKAIEQNPNNAIYYANRCFFSFFFF